MMNKMKRILFFGFVFLISGITFVKAQSVNVSASTEENATAIIDYPYYKKTERWVFNCLGGNLCNNLQGKRTEEKIGESTRGNFLKKIAGEIPVIGIGVGLSSLNEKSSKKVTEVYQPWYTKSYGITNYIKDHTYKIFKNPITIISGKFLTGEGKIEESAGGPKGYHKTTPTSDSTNIEILPQKGTGKVTVHSENVTTELSVVEESDAFLMLGVRISGSALKELAKELPVNLAKGAADMGIEMLPGGFVVTGSGILNPVTDKMEKIITRYPTYLVPLSVKVFALIPNPSPVYAVWEIEEKPVPCDAITVAGKKLDSDCRVTIAMDKKHMVRKVTPEAKVPYYKYEVTLAGPITKQAWAHTSPLMAAIYSLLGRPLEDSTSEEVVLDEDGFIVVPGWDDEKLPLASEDAQTLASSSCGDTNGDGRVTTLDIALMRKHILGLGALDVDSIDRADINRDSAVSTLDIALLRRKILGDGSFPFSCSAVPFDLTATSFDDLGTQPTPSPTLNDVTTDSIFDTISVNLKVNGQDESVTVAPGSRIIVSWISDGATRCKANWSKTDIKLSGTVAGRIKRPVTIKATCINADGERADDEVKVNVSS